MPPGQPPGQPPGPPPEPDDDGGRAWLLSAQERGNPSTRLPASARGNAVRAHVDGRAYFTALTEVLRATGDGDLVLLAGWRVDADRVLTAGGPTLLEVLRDCLARGVAVRGLVWRSHPTWLIGTLRQNRRLVTAVNAAGGELLCDHRVRALGSHHQKFVVVRHGAEPARDVAFLGGIDLAKGRGDDEHHRGDRQRRPFAAAYGPTPAWHDVQLELRGPAVADVEAVFRERWDDPAPMTRLPWQSVPDRLRGLPQRGRPLPPARSAPPTAGPCTVQLLRTYPRRRPAYPFAPAGERSVARGLAKAVRAARRLVYVEDQYLWSEGVAQLFAEALRRDPHLQVVAVAPRLPDQEGRLRVPPQLFGQDAARRIVQVAGPGRVHRFDLENREGWPVYVHAKVTVVDDVWASVGSSNLNRRSWTHDSELTAAVLDHPGAGAAGFARDLRLRLMREHLERDDGDDADLRDPAGAVAALVASAAALDAWHRDGGTGPRPPGRLRRHVPPPAPSRRHRLAPSVYGVLFDPDGRPLRMRLRQQY